MIAGTLSLLADISFWEAIWGALVVGFFLLWIWIVITILTDLFRDHETSGWGKAAWCVLLIVIPYLGSLIYLIVRGSGMRQRALEAQADAQAQIDRYIRDTAGATPVDQLHKLDQMRVSGAINEQEFERLKGEILG